jgi:hypothetical protein
MAEHPITPPPELVQQWRNLPEYTSQLRMMSSVTLTTEKLQDIATQAAQWGADQELEACVKWVSEYCPYFGDYPLPEDKLRAARRLKPPSLKEQALAALTQYMTGETILTKDSVDTIRRALEQLND